MSQHSVVPSRQRTPYELTVEDDGVRRVVFSCMTADEIRARSACEVTSVELFSGGNPVQGGLYDTRMGVVEFGQKCGTCHHNNKQCPGHPGHIELAVPVFNSLFVELGYLKKILRCVCFGCSRACFPESYSPLPSPGESALTHASDQAARVKDKCSRCASPRPERLTWNKQSLSTFTYQIRGEEGLKTLTSQAIYDVLCRIPDHDCRMMGFSPERTRPESLMFKALPVTPVAVRPPHRSGSQRRDDDITHKLSEVIKNNRRVKAKLDASADPEDIIAQINDLQLDVMQLIENSGSGSAQARMKATNRPLKSIASRLKGKEGRVRNNLMGKRVDFSARSVISAEPNISVDEVGVPVRIAMTLTFPETVHTGNIDRLRRMVSNGPRVYPGARMLRRDGITFSLERPEPRVRTELRDGDVVERHMVDGDVVLFNRQPSLHRMSMMCHRVRVMPHDTLRLNVLVTEAYNADFDGDETNIHLPQSASTAIEIEKLASVKNQIISPRHHRPIIGVVQDVALGCYLLTQDGVEVDVNTAANICARCSDVMPIKSMTGKELFSAILPSSLHCEMIGGAIVSDGNLVAGSIGKAQYQQEGCGILHSVFAEDGPDAAVRLLDNTQWMTCDWLVRHGHSMGAADIVVSSGAQAETDRVCDQAREKVAQLLTQVHSGKFVNETSLSDFEALERAIVKELDSARDTIGNLVTAEGRRSGSRLLSMVNAKSKGNPKNVVQMAGILGQNLIDGGRMPPTMGERTLPHFHRHDIGADARGFIASSFREGLSPHEFFFHAMAGREGLIDTAVKTADCGYLQRRFVKALEDLQVAADGSVRDAAQNVVSFRYGGDGMDACSIQTQRIPTFGGGIDWLAGEFLVCRKDDSEFRDVLLPEAFNKWQSIDEEGLVRLQDHFRDLVDDKTFLAHMMNRDGASLGEGNVAHAVAFARIIKKCARAHNPLEAVSDLDVLGVLEVQDALVAELYPDDAFVRPDGRIVGAALIRAHLSPKRLIRSGVSVSALSSIAATIRQRFYAGIVSPSEMVGIIAAQSIAEPSTQMTLNNFHSAGAANKASVPRVKELVAVTKNPKTTTYSVTMLPGMDTSADFAGAVRDRLLCTTVRDLVARTQMVCENGARLSDTDTRLTELEDIFDDGSPIPNADANGDGSGPTQQMRFVLRIELDRERMVEHAVSTLDVHTAIYAGVHGRVVAADDAAQELIVRVTPHVHLAQSHDLVAELREMEAKILDTRIKGVAGVTGCDVVPPKAEGHRKYDVAAADYVPRQIYSLEAVAGSNASAENLLEIVEIPGVDAMETYGDNLHHTVDLFGIEAARTLLLQELQSSYADDNTYADFRHIELLVDFITRRGVLTAITRHGVGATDAGPLTKCSFEQTVQKIVQAGMFGETDRMTGVSANVMMGQTTPCGTGNSKILWDMSGVDDLPDGDCLPLNSSGGHARVFRVEAIADYTPYVAATESIPSIPAGFANASHASDLTEV